MVISPVTRMTAGEQVRAEAAARPKTIPAPDSSGEPSVEVEAVFDLLVEAIWADVVGEIRDDGSIPEGTEPSSPDAPERVEDATVARQPETARCAR